MLMCIFSIFQFHGVGKILFEPEIKRNCPISEGPEFDWQLWSKDGVLRRHCSTTTLLINTNSYLYDVPDVQLFNNVLTEILNSPENPGHSKSTLFEKLDINFQDELNIYKPLERKVLQLISIIHRLDKYDLQLLRKVFQFLVNESDFEFIHSVKFGNSNSESALNQLFSYFVYNNKNVNKSTEFLKDENGAKSDKSEFKSPLSWVLGWVGANKETYNARRFSQETLIQNEISDFSINLDNFVNQSLNDWLKSWCKVYDINGDLLNYDFKDSSSGVLGVGSYIAQLNVSEKNTIVHSSKTINFDIEEIPLR